METHITVLGLEHPNTVTSMDNLARTWKGTDREIEAIKLIEQCVQLRKRILGVDYPHALSSSAVLAEWEAEQADIGAWLILMD